MNKEEELLEILKDFGMYSLMQDLHMDYDTYVNRSFSGGEKITEEGLELISKSPELKKYLLPMVFPIKAKGVMQTQEFFIENPNKAYDKLLIILDEEDNINEIFKISYELLSNEDKFLERYRNKFTNFLSVVVERSQSLEKIKKMFTHFNDLDKSDKTDYFVLMKSFFNKGISPEEIFESIQPLNNAYLESRLIEYLKEKNVSFSFKPNNVEMYEVEEKIIIEKIIHFNTNYFMSLGYKEDDVNKKLECFADLICNEEKDIYYLIKKKDKKFSVVIKSTNEIKIDNLYQGIRNKK